MHTINYDTMIIQNVDGFPFTFNGIIMFEFPIAFQVKSPSASKMHGMDKKDDGHIETITITTNMMNNDNLVLKNSCCIRPLCCEIADFSKYTHEGTRNETKWDGSSISKFFKGCVPPPKSTLICSFCKKAFVCLEVCLLCTIMFFPKTKT